MADAIPSTLSAQVVEQTDMGAIVPVEQPDPSWVAPVIAYLASLGSERSRQSAKSALRAITRILLGMTGGYGDDPALVAWCHLRYPHVSALRYHLSQAETHYVGGVQPVAPTTVNHRMSVLRGVLKHAWLLNQISGDDWSRIQAVAGVRGSRVAPGRAIEPAEIRKMFERAGSIEVPWARRARDVAMIALLYGCGLRRFEVSKLRMIDLKLDEQEIWVTGKGNKQRVVDLPHATLQAVKRWLTFRGKAPGCVFVPVSPSGRVLAVRCMCDETIRVAVKQLAKGAHVERVACHDFRRTYISDLLDAGVDLVTVQKLVGHDDPQTTSRYDRRSKRTRKAAVAKLDVPEVNDD